jgi:uncharacterized coiled-coil protein SlyX
MADLEHRVTRLEERSEAQTATMDYLRQDMADLRRSTEALASELRSEMASLRTELRGGMVALSSDLRGEMASLRTDLRGEMSDLRATVDSRFHWLVGLMVTGFVVTIGTIAGALWAVLQFAR